LRPLVLLPLSVIAAPALAQEAAPIGEGGEDLEREGDEILVLADRYRGEIDAPQPPIMTLDEADIAAYGAASIEELLAELGPQTGSGRGRGDGHPVILLNGQRISSFREMRDIPPEAIRRMQVLPEEVALKYGYPANQRVVNFILKDNFASQTVDGEVHLPTRGGFAESELEGSLLRIAGKSRLNLAAEIEDSSMLTEAERRIIQPAATTPTVAGDPDPARFRSLIDDSRELTLNGTWATALGQAPGAASLSLNAAYTRSDFRSLSGLDAVLLRAPDGSAALRSLPGPLTRRRRNDQFEGGLTLNKPFGGWQFTATADATYTDSETRVDRRRDTAGLAAAAAAGILPIDGPLPDVPTASADFAESRDLSLTSLATLAGAPLRLPAGDMSMTVKGGFAFTRSDNSDTRSAGETQLKRGDLSAGINLALPITSRRAGVLGGIGDLSINLSGGLNHLSDFGTLSDWSAGVTWSPTAKLSVQASYIVNEAAPSLQQLGNPPLPVFNVPVFDFSRGESVLVTALDGGNPNLNRETQRDLKIGVNWELPFLKNSNLLAEYFHNNSDDVTQSFPLLTPAIEAAFPGRVERDAGGRLIAIDRRPVTFDRIESSRLRWGFNLRGDLGKPAPVRDGDAAGGRGGGPRFGRGRGGDGRGRWNLSLYHTYRFSETVRIAPTGPVLDLLDGDAISEGGVARHSLELEGGAFYRGFGIRLRGKWAAPSRVRATGAPGSSDLRFGSTFDLGGRIFVNFDQQKGLLGKAPFLKGSRLALEFENIFDSRQKVTDASGEVPLSYQAAYREPRGRIIGLDFRKMF
jgi:hypothetical protein